MSATADGLLTWTVRPPAGIDWLSGALKLTLELPCAQDFNDGDMLHVRVIDTDSGEVITEGDAVIDGITFPKIKASGVTLGYVRTHKLKIPG